MNDDRYPYAETIIERKILYAEEELVFFQGNKYKSLKDFLAASSRLEVNGLGEEKKLKKNNSSNKYAHCFKKYNLNLMEDNSKLDAHNSLLKFHVDIEKYKKLFKRKRDLEIEFTEENCSNENKRSRLE